MASGNESKIDTKLFVSTAEALGTVSKEMETGFQDWTKVMQSLRGNWKGDTSDDFKNMVEAVRNSASVLLRTLGGYRTVLNEMAGIYDKTEKSVQETGKSLKFDKTLR